MHAFGRHGTSRQWVSIKPQMQLSLHVPPRNSRLATDPSLSVRVLPTHLNQLQYQIPQLSLSRDSGEELVASFNLCQEPGRSFPGSPLTSEFLNTEWFVTRNSVPNLNVGWFPASPTLCTVSHAQGSPLLLLPDTNHAVRCTLCSSIVSVPWPILFSCLRFSA